MVLLWALIFRFELVEMRQEYMWAELKYKSDKA